MAPVIGNGQANRDDQGITAAAVSEGNILIRSPENQTQDITGLRRETEHTYDGVDIRGDTQGIRDDLAVQSEAAALGTTVLDAYSKYAQKQVDRDNAALEAKLESEGKLDGMDDARRKATIRSHPAYNNTDYGPGSAFWTKGSAAAGLLAGALGGNLQAGAAAGAAPLLASLVKEQQNDAARAALHGIVAAALTQLAGGSSADGLKAAAAGAVTASVMSEYLVSALYGKKPEQLSADEKRLVSNLMSIVGGLAGYAVTGGDDVSMAALAANTARVEVENNFLGPESREKLDKAVENQQNAKDLLAASKEIVRQNNIDRHSDALLGKFQTDPQSMTESERQQLAAYLNVYGYELQASYGLSPERAQQLVNSLLSGEPALKPSPGYPGGGGNTSSYYEALGYLKMYSVQSSQAAAGTDALMALPGGVGTAARATLAAGGAYQAGTGIGQIIDGRYGEGALNVGLGSAAIFGGMAGQSVIKKADTGIFSPESIISLQESSRSTGKNIFPVDMFKISPENLKYVDILSPEARQHILYGEGIITGGHMYPGNPKKTIFPPTWSANKIVHAVGDITTSPDTMWYAQTGTGGIYTKAGKPSRWVAWETRDNVRVRVVYEPANGKVITAFPDAGLVPPTLKPVK